MHMTELIKITLIVGLLVMGCIYHYTGFMTRHPKLFVLELLLYMASAFVAFLFLQFMRQQLGQWKWKDAGLTVFITAVVILFAELGGLNTKFIQEEGDAAEASTDPFREEAIRKKRKMLSHMIISINFTCVMVLFLIFVFRKSRIALFILFIFAAVAIISYFLPKIKAIHDSLVFQKWLENDEISNTQLGLGIFLTVSFSVFTLVLLFSSLLHYDSFQNYSYLTNICGPKRVILTVILFIFECLMVAGLFAVPIIYVGYNRNHPELGDAYKLRKHKEVFIDFGLLTLKIFVFLVALQMTGFYE